MDELDRKIIKKLLEDSSKPVVQIASELGVTRQTVAKRIENLKRSGVIEQFTIRIDPLRFGLSTKAYVFLHEEPDPELRRRSEAEIRKLPQVSEFYRLFGRYSAVVEVLVRDSTELAHLVKRIHRLRGVRDTETFIVHSVIKNQPQAPILHGL